MNCLTATITNLNDFSNSSVSCLVTTTSYDNYNWITLAGEQLITQSGDNLIFVTT